MALLGANTLHTRKTRLIQISAVGVMLIALAVMMGWMVHSGFLVRVRPSYSSMKFNSAISLFMTGMALLLMERGRIRWAAGAATFGLVMPLATLFEYVSGNNLGIDQFFITPFIEDQVTFVGRMAPNTAAALLLMDVAIVGYTLSLYARRLGGLWLALIGSVVAALGIVPLFGYMGGLESAHTWGDFAGMALHTAFCTVLVGASLVLYAWRQSPEDPKWLPVPIAIGFLVVALSIWQAVISYEDIAFEQSLQQEADYIAGRGSDRLAAFYAAIDRIASRWVVEQGTPRKEWQADAQNYLKAYPFLKMIEWFDRDLHLQWAATAGGSEAMLDANLDKDGMLAQTAQKVFETRQSQVSDPVELIPGSQSLFYVSPLFVGDRFDGYTVAVFTLDEIFNHILLRDKTGPFYVSVAQGQTRMFSNQPPDFQFSERWHKKAAMKNGNSPWVVNIDAPQQLLAYKRSPLPYLVLVTGLLMSLFATFSMLLTLRSRKAARMLRKNEDRLHQVIDAYRLMTAHDFNVQSFMNVVVQRMQTLTSATGAVIEMIEGDEMIYQATSGSLEPFNGFRMKRAGSLSGLCTMSQEITISPDTSRDPRVNAEACRKVGAHCMVVVPLLQRSQVIGVLKVVSVTVNAFSVFDVQSLQLMAGMLGTALGQQLEMERRVKLEEQLRRIAQYDALTGLPNRALFEDRLAHALLNNRRSGKSLALMFMDLDKFKQINDTYGHADGDALLKLFAERISGVLRKGDTLARLGGDEFTLIAENMDDIASAEKIAQKILQAMKEPFTLPSVQVTVGVSIGVATSSKDEISSDQILACADAALYEVKRSGRNSFRVGRVA